MGYDAGRDLGAKWLVFHAGERNGVLWDLGATNVIDAKRVRNPAKPGFVKHEAVKDPVEFLQIIKAYSRGGRRRSRLFLRRGEMGEGSDEDGQTCGRLRRRQEVGGRSCKRVRVYGLI
jgi:hypothetical protein